MNICDFFSELPVIECATHYRSQENGKDKLGPVSKIVAREFCPICGRTGMLRTDSGINATFTTRHRGCFARTMREVMQ